MKKTIGWTLVIVGGFFCFDCVVCTSVAFTVDDATLAERIAVLVSCIALAAVNGLICWLGFKLKASKGTTKPKPADQWMTSQLPALYLQKNKTVYRNQYIGRLESIGFKKEDAKKMFDFECEVVRKFPKQYLLQPQFTKMWFFDLKQPFFRQYPKTKADILKERYLTVSELCKIIDEAEWHFWNSHEKELPDSVWHEICVWRLKGPGAEFAIRYFEMIEQATGIPEESIAKLSSEQGNHLSQHMTQSSKARSGRPEGPISVIRQLSDECSKDGAFFSFEQRTREVTLVKNQTHYFVCVREYNCVAEANGRPVSSHTEFYYTVTVSNVDGITADNWKENVVRPPAYVCHRVSEGVV